MQVSESTDAVAKIVSRAMHQPPLSDAARLSMLPTNVLDMLGPLVGSTTGAILEIGSYVGGSIIAACSGLGKQDKERKVIVVEVGGSHDHWSLPSKNILRDLKANLGAAGLLDRVTIIPQMAHDAIRPIEAALFNSDKRSATKVGFLMVDADGNLGLHLPGMAKFLAPGCILVFDDYYETTKGPRMRDYLAKCVRDGAVECFGVMGYGTWVGRLIDASRLSLCPFVHDDNFAWLSYSGETPEGDSPDSPERSRARLFEDGRELGPAHSLHEDIRRAGMGRWSHWSNAIYLSASDNTDPNTNGRQYHIEIDGRRIRLNGEPG
jgi:hypothetical protein